MWGSGFVAQRLGNEILPPMAFNSIRQIMAGIVLCPVLALDLSRSGYMSASSNTESQLRYKRRKIITCIQLRPNSRWYSFTSLGEPQQRKRAIAEPTAVWRIWKGSFAMA